MSSFEVAVPRKLRAARLLPADAARASDGGYAEGFAAGYQSGRLAAQLAARRAATEARLEMQGRLRAIQQVQEELAQISREHLPQLVLAAVTHLWSHHRFTDDEIVAEVEALLAQLSHAATVTIECCPDDLALLEAAAGPIRTQGATQWTTNPALQRGEFVLQSDLGSIDGRRLARLKQLRLSLEGAAP